VVGIHFGEDEGERLTIEEKLIPNSDETEYRAIVVKDELTQQGVRDIWVRVSREPVFRQLYALDDEEARPGRDGSDQQPVRG
jgi:hypothetical protein